MARQTAQARDERARARGEEPEEWEMRSKRPEIKPTHIWTPEEIAADNARIAAEAAARKAAYEASEANRLAKKYATMTPAEADRLLGA